MKRTHVLASILLSAALGFAQQTPTTTNPEDRTANPNPTDHTYTQTTQSRGWGNWGLLGLFGLAGLLGRRRDTAATTGYTRDDRTYEQQRRRA